MRPNDAPVAIHVVQILFIAQHFKRPRLMYWINIYVTWIHTTSSSGSSSSSNTPTSDAPHQPKSMRMFIFMFVSLSLSLALELPFRIHIVLRAVHVTRTNCNTRDCIKRYERMFRQQSVDRIAHCIAHEMGSYWMLMGENATIKFINFNNFRTFAFGLCERRMKKTHWMKSFSGDDTKYEISADLNASIHVCVCVGDYAEYWAET